MLRYTNGGGVAPGSYEVWAHDYDDDWLLFSGLLIVSKHTERSCILRGEARWRLPNGDMDEERIEATVSGGHAQGIARATEMIDERHKVAVGAYWKANGAPL